MTPVKPVIRHQARWTDRRPVADPYRYVGFFPVPLQAGHTREGGIGWPKRIGFSRTS